MTGDTPAERDIRNGPPPEGPRAAWARDVRAVLRVFETHPVLPYPYIMRNRYAEFLLTVSGERARRDLAAAEAALGGALGVTFDEGTAEGGPGVRYFILSAVLPSGLELRIKAWAEDVAEERVTGTTVTETTEWVRLPAEDEPGEAGSETQE